MRIVAGTWGGRRLVAPRGMATRPTADRVREALFSILFDVAGARVLDVFAGTGAIGLEALSRGAAHATFVENARAPLDALAKNLAALAAPRETFEIKSVPADRALKTLAREGRTFDFIFADPPYAEANALLPNILDLARALIAPGGRLVLELASTDDAPPAPEGLRWTRTKRYGETALAFYEKDDP